MERAKTKEFGQKAINNEERIIARLAEIKANFYNKLDSKKLIKKQGRIPFSEHMTITNEGLLQVPSALNVHDDIKREIAFYNLTRENVKKGMEILVQAKVPISRPDDYFAEMLKTDEHMAKVKGRLMKQQQKVNSFEERKQRLENKKFHKAIKAYKQQEKHKEKRQNMEAITNLKKKIKEKGGDLDDGEFDQMFNKNHGEPQKKGQKGQKFRVIDKVRDI